MSTNTIQLDDDICKETAHIASDIGLAFNARKEYPFSVRLGAAKGTVFDMSSDEFEAACQDAVAQREDISTLDYVTRFDKESGLVMKVYTDRRMEYILN